MGKKLVLPSPRLSSDFRVFFDDAVTVVVDDFAVVVIVEMVFLSLLTSCTWLVALLVAVVDDMVRSV